VQRIPTLTKWNPSHQSLFSAYVCALLKVLKKCQDKIFRSFFAKTAKVSPSQTWFFSGFKTRSSTFQLYLMWGVFRQCSKQGCQAVYFQTKNPILGKLEWKMLVYSMVIWNILRQFEILYGHFVLLWWFGIFLTVLYIVAKILWQPWFENGFWKKVSYQSKPNIYFVKNWCPTNSHFVVQSHILSKKFTFCRRNSHFVQQKIRCRESVSFGFGFCQTFLFPEKSSTTFRLKINAIKKYQKILFNFLKKSNWQMH
jgi:hypothetical protein